MDNSILLIVAGLALLLIVVILVRNARKRSSTQAQPAAPVESPEAVKSIPSTAPAVPAVVTLEFPTQTGPSVVYTLNKSMLTLGRAPDNDVVVPESVANYDTVSLHHAQLRRDKDDYMLRDLGSRNGVTVNGRHTLQNLLQDGDRIGFGAAEAVFHQPNGGQHEMR